MAKRLLQLSVLGVAVLCATQTAAQRRERTDSLVWFETPTEEFVTYVLRHGRVVGQRRGLFVALGRDVVEVRVEEVTGAAHRCEPEDPPFQPPVLRGRRLVVVRGGAEEVLLDAEVQGHQWVNDEIIIHASLGPFLSVERRADYFSPCSMHASPYRRFRWFDLRDGSRHDVVTSDGDGVALPAGVEAQLAEREQSLRARLRAAVLESGQDPDVFTGGPFWVEGVVPRLEGHRWGARVHVALGVPYAWSAGPAAYQMVTSFDLPDLAPWTPPELAAIPVGCQQLARRHTRFRLGGVSLR